MRIGLDASVLYDSQYTGIPKSVYEITKYWFFNYPDNEYFLFSSLPIKLDYEVPSNVHIIYTTLKFRKIFLKLTFLAKLWDYFVFPFFIKRNKIDVYWGTNYLLPVTKNRNTKYLLSIYDLAMFVIKGISKKSVAIKHKIFLKPSIEKADKIVAISKATKNDISNIFKVDQSKIEISYCGAEQPSNVKYDVSDIRDSLIIDDYFLFISTIEPRKNLITIIKAFDDYIEQTNNKTKLVIAGKNGWKYDDIYNTIDCAKHKNHIIVTGYISLIEKDYLLKHAKLFLYPSLYEGFGLPILEAFSYNLPVITTYNSSIPEVAGDAAYYLYNPYDYKELAKIMKKVNDISEIEYNNLKNKMRERLSVFSWEKNSIEMMDIIKSLSDCQSRLL